MGQKGLHARMSWVDGCRERSGGTCMRARERECDWTPGEGSPWRCRGDVYYRRVKSRKRGTPPEKEKVTQTGCVLRPLKKRKEGTLVLRSCITVVSGARCWTAFSPQRRRKSTVERDDDDVYYFISERLELEGETENMGVCTKERKGVTAEVLMATPFTNSRNFALELGRSRMSSRAMYRPSC